MTDDVRAVYGWRLFSRWLLLISVVLVTLVAVPMLFAMAVTVQSWPVRLLTGIIGGLWLVGGVLVLRRLMLTVEVAPPMLRWRGPLRRGELDMGEVRVIRPVRTLALAGVHAMELADGTTLWILVSRGFEQLVEDVRAESPQVDVRFGWATRNPGRIPGRNQYRLR